MKKTIFFGALMLCISLKTQLFAQVLLTENFGSGSLPANWTNDSLGQPAANLWIFNNQYNRSISGAGFDTNFAIFDSDEGSTNDNTDELASLTTPAVNLAGATAVIVEFDEQYRALAGPNTQGSSRKIESSSDGGLTWNILAYDSVNVGYPNPAAHTSFNVGSLGGASTIMVRFTWTGTYDWWWAIDNVTIVGLSPCIAPPTAGTTVASSSAICAGKVVYFSLTGNSLGAGLTYQWETSTDSITWVPSTGDTIPTFSDTVNATTFYHCLVTCSGQTAASTATSVTINPSILCYCSTALGGGNCAAGNLINAVTISGTGFNSTSATCTNTGDGSYTAFPNIGSLTANLNQGETYPINVTTDGSHIVSVWIDFDRNGTYDATEWSQVCLTSATGVANTVSVAIPLTSTIGLTGMRVRSRGAGNTNGATDACSNFGSGETEDYIVFIDYPLSIKNNKQNSSLTVLPNPASEKITLAFTNLSAENTQVKLTNLNGQLIFSEGLNNFSGTYSKTIDVSSFAKGIYNLQLITTNGVTNKKVVIK